MSPKPHPSTAEKTKASEQLLFKWDIKKRVKQGKLNILRIPRPVQTGILSWLGSKPLKVPSVKGDPPNCWVMHCQHGCPEQASPSFQADIARSQVQGCHSWGRQQVPSKPVGQFDRSILFALSHFSSLQSHPWGDWQWPIETSTSRQNIDQLLLVCKWVWSLKDVQPRFQSRKLRNRRCLGHPLQWLAFGVCCLFGAGTRHWSRHTTAQNIPQWWHWHFSTVSMLRLHGTHCSGEKMRKAMWNPQNFCCCWRQGQRFRVPISAASANSVSHNTRNNFWFLQIAFSSLHESTHFAHKMPQSEFQQFVESAFNSSLKVFVSNMFGESHMTFTWIAMLLVTLGCERFTSWSSQKSVPVNSEFTVHGSQKSSTSCNSIIRLIKEFCGCSQPLLLQSALWKRHHHYLAMESSFPRFRQKPKRNTYSHLNPKMTVWYQPKHARPNLIASRYSNWMLCM